MSRYVLLLFAAVAVACGGSVEKSSGPPIIILDDSSDTVDGPGHDDETDEDEPVVDGPERSVGDGVYLYWGAGGGGPDHEPEAVGDLFRSAEIPVTVSSIVPSNLTADHGVLVLLNPLELEPSLLDAARELVERGGRLVAVVDHSGYGGHDVAAAVLEAAGSSMRSVEDLRGGSLDLVLEDVPGLLDGVAEVKPYYAARVEVGDGIALGQTDDGYVALGYEKVGIGDVLVIGDASMFGYAIDHGDNSTFILNFANLR